MLVLGSLNIKSPNIDKMLEVVKNFSNSKAFVYSGLFLFSGNSGHKPIGKAVCD